MRVTQAPAPSLGPSRRAARRLARALGGNPQLPIPGRLLVRGLAHLMVISLVLAVLPLPRPGFGPSASPLEDVGAVQSDEAPSDEPMLPLLDPGPFLPAEAPPAADVEVRRKTGSYAVQPGDTLAKIAGRFKVSLDTLVWANDLADPNFVMAGAELIIPATDGVLHRVRPGDTVADLASYYGADLSETLAVNSIEPPYVILVGQRLLLPGGKMPLPSAATAPGTAEPASRSAPGSAPDVQAPPRESSGLASSVELPPGPRPLPRPTNATSQQASFIRTAAEAAQESQRVTGIPASVTIAQAILESYWGSSKLSRENNNYFGIKARERPGSAGVVWYNVWEVENGVSVVQNEPFRAYKSAADSFVDHGYFFLQNGRYARALAAKDDPQQFAREINAAGYATDPSYAPKLIGLMDRFNLYAYDLK